MSLASSVRSLSGGVITFLDELTLLATQQPLSASQVDNFRLEAPFVSYLDGDIGGAIQKVGDTVKNNTLEVEAKVDQCAALVTNSGQCKPVDNSSDNQPFDESRCKALYELFECERDAACRLCDQVAAAFFMQNRGLEKVAEYATCAQFGFKYTPECPSPMKTIILIVIGVLAVLGIGGGAFMMLRGGRKSGSRTGGINNKNQSSTGGGGGTSKSATKSAKAGSSTCGVITFLLVLTLLATQQQPLLASQVDDSRLGAPFVSYMDGAIGNFVQSVGDTAKNQTLKVETKVNQCAALVTNSGQCKQADNSTDGKLESESQCKARHEQFECERDAACRLCDKIVATALIQTRAQRPGVAKNFAACARFGFEFKLECVSFQSEKPKRQEWMESSDSYLIIYVVIALICVTAIAVGIYYFCFHRKQKKQNHEEVIVMVTPNPVSSTPTYEHPLSPPATARSSISSTPEARIRNTAGGTSSVASSILLGDELDQSKSNDVTTDITISERDRRSGENYYNIIKIGLPDSVSAYVNNEQANGEAEQEPEQETEPQEHP